LKKSFFSDTLYSIVVDAWCPAAMSFRRKKMKKATATSPDARQAELAKLSDGLNDLFSQFAEVHFPVEAGEEHELVYRFCAGGVAQNAKKTLCEKFRTVDYSARLRFIAALGKLVFPFVSSVVTTPTGVLEIAHTRNGSADVFACPVGAGIIGELFTETMLGTLAMNPLCALLQWIERGSDPGPKEQGFTLKFK
jgi:hypothetical protein